MLFYGWLWHLRKSVKTHIYSNSFFPRPRSYLPFESLFIKSFVVVTMNYFLIFFIIFEITCRKYIIRHCQEAVWPFCVNLLGLRKYTLWHCQEALWQGPPEWRRGLRHCVELLAVPLEILGSSPGPRPGDPWDGASSAAWLGCVSEDARLLTFASPESVRDLQPWDKTVITKWIPRNWGGKRSIITT